MEFSILGKPKAQARHRSFKRGKFSGIYDPSAKDKKTFLEMAMFFIGRLPNNVPYDEPIKVTIFFFFNRPKADYRTGKFSGELKDSVANLHMGRKPDIDNLQKFVFDALNKIFWRDDSLIAEVHCYKAYAKIARTEIVIETIL